MVFAEDYLRDPSVFPSTSEGAPWGGHSVTIDFSGGPYIFERLDESQENTIRSRFVGFCVDSGKPPPKVLPTTVLKFDPAAFKAVDFSTRDYTFDRLYLKNEILLAGLNFIARITRTPGLSASLWTSANRKDDFPFIFENVFRVLVAYRLLELGGTILHSACAAYEGHAYLMLGNSGAGKSTFSRMALAAGWEVLSDDMNAVRLEDGQWVVEKLPFAGDLGQTPSRSNRYPLAGIFRLNKSDHNRLTPWSRGQAVAKALGCSPVVNDDPYRTDPLLNALERMAASVPTRQLEFSLDGGALKMLPEVLDHND
jgi:hypothetical protein